MDRSQGASPGVLTFDSLHSSGAGVITATDLDFDRLEALDYWGASEMWPSEVTHCPAKKNTKRGSSQAPHVSEWHFHSTSALGNLLQYNAEPDILRLHPSVQAVLPPTSLTQACQASTLHRCPKQI